MFKFWKNPTKIFLNIILVLSVPFSIFSTEIHGLEVLDSSDLSSNIGKSTQEQLADIQKQLEENRAKQIEYANLIQQEKSNQTQYNNEITILENQIYLLNEQISETELVIQELNLQIEILTKEIEELEVEIEIAQNEIKKLENETDGRLLNMYIAQKERSSTSSEMFSSDGPSALVKNDTYRQALQEDTNVKLEILQGTREQLEKDKIKLEENKISVDKNRVQVEEEKIALDRKRTQADSERNTYIIKLQESSDKVNQYDKILAILPAEEQELVNKANQLKNALLSRKEVVSGLPIKAGTFIGIEGNTGYSYGAHLHFGVSVDGVIKNPCNYLPAGAYGNCGGNGQLVKPIEGAVLTSGFRTAARPTHNAIDLSTGGGASIVAAHDGYVYYFFEPCPSWAPVCNNGGAIAAKICETDKCESGFSTIYYHMACTAEPKGTGNSCK